MQIGLRLPDPGRVRLMTREYDEELDDVRSILSDVCAAIDTSGELIVSGFGQSPWPATVRPDLAVLLEQLPEFLKAVAAHEPATLDFYEQGLERSVTFTPDVDGYRLSCASLGRWQPNPSTERMSYRDVGEMFGSLMTGFVAFLEQTAPELAKHPWIRDWMRSAS